MCIYIPNSFKSCVALYMSLNDIKNERLKLAKESTILRDNNVKQMYQIHQETKTSVFVCNYCFGSELSILIFALHQLK